MSRFWMFSLILLIGGCSKADLPTAPEDPEEPKPELGAIQVTVQAPVPSGLTIRLQGPVDTTGLTGSQGKISFKDMPVGLYGITLEGFPSSIFFSPASQFASVKKGETSNVTFIGVAVQEATITGTVTASGEMIAGVEVSIKTGLNSPVKQTLTDLLGGFFFSGIGVGTYVVSIKTDTAKYVFTSIEKSVSVSDPRGSYRVDFTGTKKMVIVVDQFNTITGRVTIGGIPISGITMTLGGVRSVSIQTDASGNYTFSNLPTGGFTVTVTPPMGSNFPFFSFAVIFEGLGETQTLNFSG